jgi:hypothetical protein
VPKPFFWQTGDKKAVETHNHTSLTTGREDFEENKAEVKTPNPWYDCLL